MELLKDLEKFSHRIKTALCSASDPHTQNERSLKISNLRLQYSTSFSVVVTAITTRLITPEVLPVSLLKKCLNINNTLFDNDILTAYSLSKIHHNIYRLNERLIVFVVFPTAIAKIFRLYKPFILTNNIAEK